MAFFLLALGVALPAHAGMEVFAKGTVSKTMLSEDAYIVSFSAATGIAFQLLPRIRVEARYTNSSSLQNELVIQNIATLNDVMTETVIYSAGLDFDILGQKSAFQPFLYLGGGYVQSRRSYYVTAVSTTESSYMLEPVRTGVSVNAGAGFRIAIARALALELEAFAYAVDVHTPNPLINLFGSAGIRIFL